MAQDGIFATGQPRRLLDCQLRGHGVTHEEHAAVDLMKAPDAQTEADLMPAYPGREQLLPRDNAMLAFSTVRNHSIGTPSEDFSRHTRLNPALGVGAPSA